MGNTFTSLPKLFVGEMVIKWMDSHIKVVSQFSKVVKWNKYNQQIELIYISRDKWMNILTRVDFSKLCHIIKNFP